MVNEVVFASAATVSPKQWDVPWKTEILLVSLLRNNFLSQ